MTFGEKLDWDSQCFGYPVFRLNEQIPLQEVEPAVRMLKEGGAELMVWQVREGNAEHDRAAISAGGTLVDRKYVYELPLTVAELRLGCSRRDYPTHFVCGRKPYESWFYLAREAGKYSRYRLDPRMNRGEFTRLYDTWLQRSLNREIANYVWVIGEVNDPAGLITLATRAARGEIGLVAVAPLHRGKGVATRLLDQSVSILTALRCEVLSVATQAENKAARRLYERYGFRLTARYSVYHFWR
jgi:dTDP-4-amino-4,6-dideoxy-D-galactose acyltransferase